MHRTSDNVRQKNELYPTKTTSKRTRLPGVKLKKIISYRRLKTQKHSIRIGLYCSSFFLFYKHFEREFIYTINLYSKPEGAFE